MLHIDTLVVGDYQVNCYIVRKENESRCVIIDPGYEAEEILSFLKSNQLQMEAILLTHGHFDHVGAVKELAAQTGCRVFVSAEEDVMPPQMTAGPLYRTDTYPSEFQIAGLDISVMLTPGHTPGSVCLIIENTLFSGDTLFAGSCGRTDLPGGDWKTLQKSLASLRALEGNYQVFPGHGESSTLDVERQYNPYM